MASLCSTELLRREKLVSGSVHLGMFYIRRALRIWPLYYLAVAIGLMFSFKVARFHLAKAEVLTYLFFLKNWDIVFRGWNWNPIFILWTVSAEEQFYLVWPFAQKVLNRRRLIGLCVAAIAIIPLVVFYPHGIFIHNHATQQIFTFLYFPIGSLIALGLNGRRKEAHAGWCLALLAAGLGLWFSGSYLVRVAAEPVTQSPVLLLIVGRLLIIPGTISIFFAFFKSHARWSWRPLAYLGKISFGLYVFHATVLYLVEQFTSRLGLVPSTHITYVAVHLSIAMVLTIAVAALSYELYEKQFLRLKDRFAIVHSRAI